MSQLQPPSLSLYIHLPWCIRKCPYCDFNSFRVPAAGTAGRQYFAAYTEALLRELESEAGESGGRKIVSIYLGGGTPSLFPPEEIRRIIGTARNLLATVPDIEISMEANPGTVTPDTLAGYREAGVNRLSLGIQSLNEVFLRRLCRIHSREEAIRAISAVREIFPNFNLDLMHSLPGQSASEALSDLSEALSFNPPHLSWYQLTLEENTPFGQNPPALPSEEVSEEICLEGFRILECAGYTHYEVSAFTRERPCIHNSNYWKFGDYLAVGAGAHSKISMEGRIVRKARLENPEDYIRGLMEPGKSCIREKRIVSPEELLFEYLLNRLRLFEPISAPEFEAGTGLPFAELRERLRSFEEDGLVKFTEDALALTARGTSFVNTILADFL